MYLQVKIITFTIISFFVICTYNNSYANLVRDYPKTKEERQIEEMGSIIDNNPILFRSDKVKNTHTKSFIDKEAKVNKYLWQASINVLNEWPLLSTDYNAGIIITDWHYPKDKKNYSLKAHIFIKDNSIKPESIEVKLFEKILQSGKWGDNVTSSDIAFNLKEKILSIARSLYIDSIKK